MSDKDLKFKKITDDIIHIQLPTREKLAEAMIRFQEYYESPFPDIRGKIFTLGYVRSKGSRHMSGVATYEGGKHYEADWSGYNFPSHILDPFVRGLFDPLTSYEQDIVNALKCKEGKFYIIGTFGEDDPSETLTHEICHALYYINPQYKKEVDVVLKQYNLSNFKKAMREWGYCEEVLDDECHAYMSADYDWFFSKKKEDVKKFNIKIDRSIHIKLSKIREKHFKAK